MYGKNMELTGSTTEAKVICSFKPFLTTLARHSLSLIYIIVIDKILEGDSVGIMH